MTTNLEQIRAALRENVDALIDQIAGDIAHLGSKPEWSMDDNFNVTEGIVGFASNIGLPSAGNQSLDDLIFYMAATRENGEHVDDDFQFKVKIKVDNVYDNGTITETKEVEIPLPPDQLGDDYDEWAYDNLFCHTGTGRTHGEAGYFVEVLESELASLVGEKFEWGT